MSSKQGNSNERQSPGAQPEEALDATLDGAGIEKAEPDTISDPGVEGGVDAPNEEPEGPDTEA